MVELVRLALGPVGTEDPLGDEVGGAARGPAGGLKPGELGACRLASGETDAFGPEGTPGICRGLTGGERSVEGEGSRGADGGFQAGPVGAFKGGSPGFSSREDSNFGLS